MAVWPGRLTMMIRSITQFPGPGNRDKAVRTFHNGRAAGRGGPFVSWAVPLGPRTRRATRPMDLIPLYPGFKLAHVGFVIASGTLFAVRGLGTLTGAAWPAWLAVRRLSYAIDSGLLLFALLLLATLRLNPFAVPWLATKLALLVVYIVLGSLALKRARSPAGRTLAFIAALLCFGYIVSVALAHDPLGVFAAR